MSSAREKSSPPGSLSRIGFRLMAWGIGFSRRSLDMEAKLRASDVAVGQTVLDLESGPGHLQ